jgi:hypothetical protein
MNRYFLDKNGAKTFRAKGRPGEGHLEIGREVLAAQGVIPQDIMDTYTQMFRLKYVRVVEHPNRVLEIEYQGRLTSGQKQFIAAMERAGWTTKRLDHGKARAGGILGAS